MKPLLSLLCTALLLLVSTGCNAPAIHPGAVDQFDSDSYDSLLVAHVALVTMAPQIKSTYPTYEPLYNQLVASYNTAEPLWLLYHNKQGATQAAVSAQIANVVVAVVALENQFRIGLNASAATVKAASAKTQKLKSHAVSNGVTIGDILTYLELGSAIAQTIPAAAPYAALASLVIQIATQATASLTAASGQPIDLTAVSTLSELAAASKPNQSVWGNTRLFRLVAHQ